MMEVLAALIPSIGVGALFYYAMRAMIGADRRERAALAELDRLERLREQAPATRDAAFDHDRPLRDDHGAE